MEERNSYQEQEVWQRVFAPPRNSAGEDLRRLQLEAMELAAAYRHLSGTMAGRSREKVRGLYRGAKDNVACLQGLGRLSGAGSGKTKTMPVPNMAAEKLLELCYHKTRRTMTEYTARSMEPEFGEVFRKMAQREGEHCVVLAELLGEEWG